MRRHRAGRKMTIDTGAHALRADVEDFLCNFAGQKVLFYPNPGNAGDCLILSGTMAAFDRTNIKATIIGQGADVSGRTIFIGGGGNFIDLYADVRQMIEICHARAERFVLLPHTIRGNEKLIASLDGRATLWCRETPSLQHVRNLNPALDCRSGHDMAFHCDPLQFLNDPIIMQEASWKLDADLAGHGTSLLELSKLDSVRFMRRDCEALDLNCQSDLDVSTAFGEASDDASARVISWCLLKTVSVARRIITDRLHVAIAAALLKRPCELLDNAYNKNRSVYEHSLAGFPNLSFKRVLALPLPDQPPPRQRSLLGNLRRNARKYLRKHIAGEDIAQ